jgi:hypothetical protein
MRPSAFRFHTLPQKYCSNDPRLPFKEQIPVGVKGSSDFSSMATELSITGVEKPVEN